MQRLDKMLNRFDPESEVSFVNREAGHYPVTVGEELWNILLNCKRYNELTEGNFDITLQGFDQVLLTEEDKSIFFFSESLHIDLGGYGKGIAVKRKVRRLLLSVVGNDLIARFYAVVADVCPRRRRNEKIHLILAASAEGAAAFSYAFVFGHIYSVSPTHMIRCVGIVWNC